MVWSDDSKVNLSAGLEKDLRSALPAISEHLVRTIIAEVPSYSEPFRGRMGRNIEAAVTLALTGFLDRVTTTRHRDRRLQAVYDAAYQLGRGEARNGRSMDALAAAYRVGLRAAWRDLSRIAVEHELAAEELGRFAGLVFDYIDELSDISVSGHADELASRGRLRERRLSELAAGLLDRRPADQLESLAEQAGWSPPRTMTAVVLPQATAPGVRVRLDPRTLELSGDVAALEAWPDLAVLLVPSPPSRREALLRMLEPDAVVGPTRVWTDVGESFRRTVRALELDLRSDGPVDTEARLADLVVLSDRDAHTDLRKRVLKPLDELRPAAREKLVGTLRAWLLHQGRRDDMAQALFVHPQTVRYRMGQLRDAYGDRLLDPEFVREATIALV